MTRGAPASISVQRRIEWVDTDASGHYHHTAAFRLFETAETLLLAHLGLRDEIYGRLPRVSITANFSDRLLFGDLVTTTVTVARVGRSSLTYDFDLSREGQRCAAGSVTAVLLDGPLGRAQHWPREHRTLLLTAGEQPPEFFSSQTPRPDDAQLIDT